MMCHEILKKHKFQFIRFCNVHHEKYLSRSNVQVNTDSHILHITAGHGKVFINSEMHNLKRGIVLNIPPFSEFNFEIESGLSMMNIHYRMWTGNGDPLEDLFELPLSFEPSYFNCCEKILNRMEKIDALPLPEKLEIEMLAHKLAIKHFISNKLLPPRQHSNDVRINKIFKLLQSPDCLEYDAGKVAKSCFLSVSQMNRRFKHYFNIPPQKFWEKNRFNSVCRVLRKNDRSLAEIADAFAFSDQAYFSKWFKKTAKMPPLEYRKKASRELGFTV